MANIFEQGAELIASQFGASCSKEVTYSRGATSVTLLATVDATEFELDDGSSAIDRVETRDFLLDPDELAAASLWPPARGDLITEVLDGTSYSRTVNAPEGAPHWEHDGYLLLARVRTWQRQQE